MEQFAREFLVALLTGGAAGAAVVWLLREWISDRLKSSIEDEYARKLEDFKHRLEVDFQDEVRRRALYEGLTCSLEQVFSDDPALDIKALSLSMNRLFGLLALYAPDDVYASVRNALADGAVYGESAMPVVYLALRKSLLGARTKLELEDLVAHQKWQPVPRSESSASS